MSKRSHLFRQLNDYFGLGAVRCNPFRVDQAVDFALQVGGVPQPPVVLHNPLEIKEDAGFVNSIST